MLTERLKEPLDSYIEKRNTMKDMLSTRSLANIENIQKNIHILNGYKTDMKNNKSEIMTLLNEIEECILSKESAPIKLSEAKIAEYQDVKEKLGRFFKLDGYFIQGFDKTIKFMWERRGAYFVKEDRITFVRLNDWEYYRYMKHQMKEIANRQNLVINSIYYSR